MIFRRKWWAVQRSKVTNDEIGRAGPYRTYRAARDVANATAAMLITSYFTIGRR